MSYNVDMKKTRKTRQLGVRLDEATVKELEKEALAKGLDVSTYIRTLVFTHPDRPKRKN